MLFGGCGGKIKPKKVSVYLNPEEDITLEFLDRKYSPVGEETAEYIRSATVDFMTLDGKSGVAKLDISDEIDMMEPNGQSNYMRGRRIDVYNQKKDKAFLAEYCKNQDKEQEVFKAYWKDGTVYWHGCMGGVLIPIKMDTDKDGLFRNLINMRMRKLRNYFANTFTEDIFIAENGDIVKVVLKDYYLSPFSKNKGKYKKLDAYFCYDKAGYIAAMLVDFDFDFGEDDYGEWTFVWQTNKKPQVNINDLSETNLKNYKFPWEIGENLVEDWAWYYD